MSVLKSVRAFATCCAVFASTFAVAAPTLLVTDGILMGADKVDVGGTVYDVRFSTGTCGSLFNGCKANSFTFHNAADASVAANALLDQVFVDSGQGMFDSKSDLSYNCRSNIQCDTIIPYSLDGTVFANSAVARNMSTIIQAYSDAVLLTRYEAWFDTTRYFGGLPLESFAVFTLSATTADVPEPGTTSLMALALAAFVALRRNHRSRRVCVRGRVR